MPIVFAAAQVTAALSIALLSPDAHVSVPCDTPSLINAVLVANASGSPTSLDLAPGCLYTLTSPHNAWYGPNALPAITSNITVEGNGAEIRAAGATPFRLFYVSGGLESPAGSLTLKQVTLRGGHAKGGDSAFGGAGAGMGGAIFNQGTLTLDAVTLTGNTAQGGSIGNNASAGGGMGSDAQGFNAGGFGPGFAGVNAGFGGAGGINTGGGGGGGFIPGADGYSGAGATGGPGGGTGGLGTGGADGGAGGNVGLGPNSGGAGGGGVGGGGGAGAGSISGNGGDFGFGGHSGPGTGGSGGFGGGGGSSGGGAGTTGGAGGFGGGGGGSIGGVGGPGGFGGGNGSSNNGSGGAGGGFGGAIFNHRGSLVAINTTMTGNSAIGGTVPAGQMGTPSQPGRGLGGALFNLDGTVTLTFATIASNGIASGSGVGDGTQIYTLAFGNNIIGGGGTAAQLTLVDSIVSGTPVGTNALVNSAVNGLSQNSATLTRTDANIVVTSANFGDAASVGPPAITADPLLQPLANNGGPTMTMALISTSPAVDAASNGGVVTDQRGFPRGAVADLGAFELLGDAIFGNGYE